MDKGVPALSLLPLWLFLAACAVELAASLLSRRSQGPSSTTEEAALQQSIRQLRKRADQLNTPATFAKSAKLLREVAAKEKALAELQGKGRLPRKLIAWGSVLRLAFRGVTFLLYRNTAVLSLPLATVQPLGRLLAWPHGASWQGGGAVAILPWLTISLVVGEYVIKWCFPRLRKEHKA